MKARLIKMIILCTVSNLCGAFLLLKLSLIWNLTSNWNGPRVLFMTTMSLLPFPAKNMPFSPFAIYRHLETDGSYCREIWYPMKHLGIPSFLLTGLSSHNTPVPCFPCGLSEDSVIFAGLFASTHLFPPIPLRGQMLVAFPGLWPFQKPY